MIFWSTNKIQAKPKGVFKKVFKGVFKGGDGKSDTVLCKAWTADRVTLVQR